MPEFIVRQRIESTITETFMVEAGDKNGALDQIAGLEPVDVVESGRTKRTVEHQFPDEVEGEG